MHRLDAVSTRRRLDSTPSRLDAAGGQTQNHSFTGAFPQDCQLGSLPGEPAQKVLIFYTFLLGHFYFCARGGRPGQIFPRGRKLATSPRRQTRYVEVAQVDEVDGIAC